MTVTEAVTGVKRDDGQVRSARTVWWGTLFICFLLSTLWALSLPTFAGFDEAGQFTRAASLVRLQVQPEWIPAGEGRIFEVELPYQYATRWAANDCFALNPDLPAGCLPPFDRHDGEATTTYTPYGNYPPLYYALTGWPTLGLRLAHAIWAVRLASALLCSACLASAVTAAWSHRRSLLLGLAVATTPLVLALHAMVNPSAVEVAASVLTWVALMVVIDRSELVSRRDVVRLAVAAALLAHARPASMLWLGLILATGVVWCGLRRARQLLRQRDVQFATAAIAVFSALAIVWYAQADYGESVSWTSRYAIPGRTLGYFVGEAYGRTGVQLQQMVGRFGYLDVGSPRVVFVVWAVVVLFLMVAAVARGTRRRVIAFVGLAVVVIVLPPLLEAPTMPAINYWWQGRYTLPLAVGVPILASGLIAKGIPHRAGVRVVFSLLWFGQVASYYWALHRFTVGDASPTWTLTDGPANVLAPVWHPPLGAWTLVGLYAVTAAGFYVWLASLLGRRDRSLSTFAAEESALEVGDRRGPDRSPHDKAVAIE